MNANIIYALHHPDSMHVYVGKSKKGLTRAKEHGRSSYMQKWPHLAVVRWAKKLQDQGKTYEIAILEECESDKFLDEAEKYHISYLKWVGVPLLNLTEGGEGVKPTPETLLKMSKAQKGKIVSPETRAKLSAAFKGVPLDKERADKIRRRNKSAESRAAVSARRKGKSTGPVSDETRLKLSLSHKGKVFTEEHRKNISLSKKGKKLGPQSVEQIRKSALARIGLKRTPEQCKNISTGVKAACVRKKELLCTNILKD